MTRRQLIAYVLAGTVLAAVSFAWLANTLFRTEFRKPTELHLAAGRNDVATIERWIGEGRNLNVKYNNPGNLHEGSGLAGQTALMFAAERGHLEAVRALVEGGADMYLETWRPEREGYAYSAFDYAVKGGNPQVVKYLWEVSDKESFRKRISFNLGAAYERFCRAPAPQSRESARALIVFLLENLADSRLAADALPYVPNRDACAAEMHLLLSRATAPTPLALVTAARLGLVEITSLYLERGVDVNAFADVGYVYPGRRITALMAAAGAAKLKTVEVLLDAGADPNLRDASGRTALIAAVLEEGCSVPRPSCDERLAVMKTLLSHSARTDIRDRQGKTALDYADWHSADLYVAEKKAILAGPE